MTITVSRRSIAATSTPLSTPRLRLEPTGSRRSLDGGWWPRSTDLAAELPGLVLAIDAVHGPVTRLLLSASGWDSLPQRLQVTDRSLPLGYYTSQPASLLTALCDNGDRVELFVVAPRTEPATAQAAMMTAAATGNLVQAQQILTHLPHLDRSSRAGESTATEDSTWEDDGGQLR